jgi:hypothetical protein
MALANSDLRVVAKPMKAQRNVKKRSGSNLVEPSMYLICILGTLDKNVD